MKKHLKDLIDSLKNDKSGWSGRKLTALVIVLCVVSAHIKWLSLGDFTLMSEVFMIDYSFIAALFGMTTYQNLKSKDTTEQN